MPIIEIEKPENYISLQEAAKICKYSQEYLSLRARQGKLKALKIGRNWVTKKEWLEQYLGGVDDYKNNLNGNGKKNKIKQEKKSESGARFAGAPRNLPVGDFELIPVSPFSYRFSQALFKKFKQAIANPAIRFGFAFVLVFALMAAAFIFNKDSLNQIAEDAALYETASIFGEYSQWVKENIKKIPGAEQAEQFIEKIDQEVKIVRENRDRNLILISDGLEEFSLVMADNWNKIAAFFKDTAKYVFQTLIAGYQDLRDAYLAIRDSVNINLALGNKKISYWIDAFFGGIKFITYPWEAPPTKEIAKLEEEGVITKEIIKELEISKITKIEEIEQTIKQYVQIDDVELAMLKNQLKNLDSWKTDMSSKLQSYSGNNNIPTSPIYISAPGGIEVGGHGSFVSLGVQGSIVGNSLSVKGSTYLGTNPSLSSDTLTMGMTSTFLETATFSKGIAGNLGIGDISADYPLEVLATTTQFAIANTDGTAYAEFYVNSDGDLNIKPSGGNVTINDAYTLSSAAPSNDQILKYDSSTGLVGWETDAGGTPGGSDGQLQYNNGGSFGGASQFYYDGANNRVGIGDTSPDYMLEVLATTTQLALTNVDASKWAEFFVNSSGDLEIKPSGGNVSFGAYTFPSADGSSGQYLKTDGSGNMSWDTPAGSGDILSVGDCASGACFDGTQGTQLTFYNAGGNGILSYNSVFNFNKNVGINDSGADYPLEVLATTTQLALTNVDASKWAEFFVNSSGDLTIDSIGDVKIAPSGGDTYIYGTLRMGNAYAFPTTDGSASQVLQTNGSGTLSWAAAGSGSPGGSDTQIQYNNGGAFGGATGFVWDDVNNRLGVGDTTPDYKLEVLDTTTHQLALAYTDDTTSTSFWTDSNGDLTIIPTGGDVFMGTGGNARLTASKLIGGTATTSNLYLQTTSGVGATGADMHFLVGNNGATEAMTILNSGYVGIGTTGPDRKLDILDTATQMRLTYTDGSVFTEFKTDSSGNLSIDPSGGNTSFAGNIGIGVSAPAYPLHVVGQCVTGDTKLRRRRRKKKNGEYIYEDVMIKDIQPGDEIQTLNEATGKLVWSKVKALMDMGVKPIYKLTTASGKTIRTTGNHPYLVNLVKTKITKPTKVGRIEIDQSIRIEELTKDTIIGLGAKNLEFSIIVPRKVKRHYFEIYRREGRLKLFAPALFSIAIINLLKKSGNNPSDIIIDIEYPGYERFIANFIKVFFPDSEIDFKSIGKKSIAHYAVYGVFINKKKENNVLGITDISRIISGIIIKNGQRTVTPPDISRTIRSPHKPSYSSIAKQDALSRPNAKTGKWMKVAGLEQGMEIAVVGAIHESPEWDKIIKIEQLPAEQVYDIEVENTHNFVGNGIIAHNTYISTSLITPKVIGGTATTSDLYLQTTSGVGATGADMHFLVGNNGATEAMTILNSGYIGIGTTGPDRKLDILDTATQMRLTYTDGSVFTEFNVNSSGDLLIEPSGGDIFTYANIGIGTSSPSQKLDLIGSLELEATTTSTTGVIYKGANRFIHNFQHPTGGGAIPVGYNTFVGVNAGNFTMGSTATQTYHASYNTGIGYQALQANTIGFYNSAMGYQALYSNTDGTDNSAVGMYALYTNTDGNDNSAVGNSALYANTTGFYNSAVGNYALYYTQTGGYNTAIGAYAGQGVSGNSFSNNSLFGYSAGFALSTGSNNILLGYQAGDALTTGATNIVIGYNIDLPAVGSANMLDIGNLIYATGLTSTGTTVSTGLVGIGDTSPDYKLEVLATTTQLGLSYTDGTQAQFWVDSSGDLRIEPSGGDIIFPAGTTLGSGAEGDIYFFDGNTSGENYELRIYGYIAAASGASFAALNLDDTNDEFLIDVSDGNGSTTLDAAIRLDDTAGASVFRIRDSGGTEVFYVDSDGIVKMYYNTSAPSLDANGEMAVGYVASTNRIYFYSNGGIHYVDATAGFGIPEWETNDPITGEPIAVGNFVMGVVEKQREDGSLHGLWINWDTVKEQSWAELFDELSAAEILETTSSSAGEVLSLDENGSVIVTTTESASSAFAEASAGEATLFSRFVNSVKKALSSIGLFIENGVARVKSLVASNQVCIGETCINEEQLKQLLENNQLPITNNQTNPNDQNNVGAIQELPVEPILEITTPSAEPSTGQAMEWCDNSHLGLCDTREKCEAQNLYWYGEQCHLQQEAQTAPTPEPIPEPAPVLETTTP